MTLHFDYEIPSETFDLPLLHPGKLTCKPIIVGLGRCFSLEQGGISICIFKVQNVRFLGLGGVSRIPKKEAPLCRGGFQGLDRCEKHLHTRSLRRKNYTPGGRGYGGIWWGGSSK